MPASNEELRWVVNTATLIYGGQDAVLIDTFLTVEQSHYLVELIVTTGKNLTTIYITHAHADHFYSIKILQDHFPNAKVVAMPATVKAMRPMIDPDYVKKLWKTLLSEQIPTGLLLPEELKGNEIDLEGHKLIAINLGFTDTNESTCLHVPSIGLVVAGDAAYNGIHPYLAETNVKTRLEWIAALDKIEALKPSVVIAGHKIPENDDAPRIIEKTRAYLLDFNRLDKETKTAHELYDKMLKLYPNRVNPGSLWGGSFAAKSNLK